MHIETLTLNTESELIRNYKNQDDQIMNYFDYLPFNTYEKRLKDLQNRAYDREALTKKLLKVNTAWDAPEETLTSIKKLKYTETVVVVGGQQAGLLTGPLYTIHKIISLIQLAKKQEKELGVPVVPVFWIAGEDHDYEEINHVHLSRQTYFKKHKLNQEMIGKPSVSNIPKQEQLLNDWLDEVFRSLKETEYTKEMIASIQDAALKSQNYVDFFARLIFHLFPTEGIILLDSGSEDIRKLESSYFESIIRAQEPIAEGVYHAKQSLEQLGYAIMLELKKTSGHLFYEKNQERLLLEKTIEGTWADKEGQVNFTTEELIEIAKKQPYKLSNNVVTRPIMQELLLPTLAFIGGNGEIAYWSTLKPAFHALGLKMPPVLPRLSFTLTTQKANKVLNGLSMTVQNVLDGETEMRKTNWLSSQTTQPVNEIAIEVNRSITSIHEPLRNIANDLRVDIGNLAEENLSRIQKEIEFLQGKINLALQEKYQFKIEQFDFVQHVLFPNHQLQERIWNSYTWINEYGMKFIRDLCNEDCSFVHNHHVVHL